MGWFWKTSLFSDRTTGVDPIGRNAPERDRHASLRAGAASRAQSRTGTVLSVDRANRLMCMEPAVGLELTTC